MMFIVGILFGVMLGSSAVLFITLHIIGSLKQQVDHVNNERYQLLVRHEGWRYVRGLPLPIPPIPEERTNND
jgi:hypothetical protein